LLNDCFAEGMAVEEEGEGGEKEGSLNRIRMDVAEANEEEEEEEKKLASLSRSIVDAVDVDAAGLDVGVVGSPRSYPSLNSTGSF